MKHINERDDKIITEADNEILKKCIELLVYQVANDYLDFIDNYKSGEAEELVLEYLDESVNLAKNISNLDIFNLSNMIVKVNREEQRMFNRALEKKGRCVNLCKRLNFIYMLIKVEELQQNFLDKLKSSCEELEKTLKYDSGFLDINNLRDNKLAKEFNYKDISKNMIYNLNNKILRKSF